MATTLLHSLVQVEAEPNTKPQLPALPERAVPRSYPAAPRNGDNGIELSRLREPQGAAKSVTGSSSHRESSRPGTSDGIADPDVEMSPQNPTAPADAFDILPSLSSPPMNKYRLMTACLINFVGGITDAAPGALIPYMETHYNIGYAVVSLIFVGTALGFIVAAPLIDTLRQTLGRARALMLSQLLLIMGFIPLVSMAPFPSVVVGFFFISFGAAVPLAMNNVFCANLRNGTTMLGLMHGSYGVGGTAAPLIATALITQTNMPWGRYYLFPLGFTVFNCVFGGWAFWAYEQEQLGSNGITEQLAAGAGSSATRTSGREVLVGMFRAFRLRVAMLGALFLFAYQGAEVSISGWVISFLIATRNGDPSSVGYVTSGFWAGITIGRFVLSPVGARIGEKLFVYLLIGGAAVFQLLVWLVPNIIAESVSLAIVGLLLGPVYPCAAAVFARNFSRKEQVAGLGLISAFGTSGGAFAPFTTGLLAQAAGTFVLHPIAIGLFAVMAVTWFGLPSARKRTD
ncbi:major facilitator superfamily domain-containing protein [Microdochium trichocladiopsis]|uniref:Major facilitator superfamily domain-containing protein n=1 Tax=Microdochium trichocladiopsis TaxID=1682393 RepID=A0A9P9BQV9_9PEZI|nr:major facilitator superfamily domain-containing protein [Microdochium trichocladiopsis]KAH7031250.1 major facilitator superfamily domain-containing protein [Microdochium trichocladiopsis]